MWRFAQVGIALGALGVIFCFMGLFPGITGARTTIGIGLVQVSMLVLGYALIILGALNYLKFTFYLGVPSTLSQQVGVRLALSGLLFAGLAGLADIFGFGSHIRSDVTDIYLGQLQLLGILASFALSSLGVLVYALAAAHLARNAPAELLRGEFVDSDAEDILPDVQGP